MLVTSAPRVESAPPAVSSLGRDAVELAASAGLVLDRWQADVLERALGVRGDGKWAAFEVGLVVSRQNGKGAILEARELAGLFLLGERMIIHSAHQFDTSLEAYRRLRFLIEETPELDAQVRRYMNSHGEEGIELKTGARIRFRTRTKGGGRGFSSDCLVLDEAMVLPEFSHGALLPTLSARPNPQVWYTGSAVDQFVHDDGIVLARLRERGLKGDDPSLAYFEWSAADAGVNPDALELEVVLNREAWAAANPGLGTRISEEHVEYEQRSMDARTFAVERLGVGDWPVTNRKVQSVIDLEVWKSLLDVKSAPTDPVCFAFDVSPNRSSGSIAVSASRDDDLAHVEVVDHRQGTGWMVDRLEELWQKHLPSAIVCDKASPASSLLDELGQRGVTVHAATASEHARACGMIFDLVEQGRLRHLGQSSLATAIAGAKTRPLGDAWAWARMKSSADITPLVASTLALWAAMREQPSVYEGRAAIAV